MSKTPDFIEILGPMWQYECGRCGHMDEVYTTRLQAERAAKKHDCVTDGRRFRWFKISKGVYRGEMGYESLEGGKLVMEARIVEDADI